jgi:soluble lytic murein transglycosylase-like protein
LSEEVGFTDFFDPEQNVTAGLYMLRDLFEKYEDPALVLMTYNMGETGAKRLWDKGIYTSDYAEAVLQQAEIYNEEIQERMGENGQM